MLSIEKLSVFRGENRVLQELNLQVREQEIVSVIGANGAGKSTLFESIFGFLTPKAGSIQFQGHELVGLPAFQIAKLGLACVPEGRRLFGSMTVLENIELPKHLARSKPNAAKNLAFIFDLFPVLKDRLRQEAGTLSGGEQQMVALARALMLSPSLLLVDEVSLGLSPKYTDAVFAAFQKIKMAGVSILLVEQNAMLALEYSDRAYVLENGRIVKSASARALSEDPAVRRAYLGL